MTRSSSTSSFTIPVPRDYVLRRDLCSYGYFLLWPNHWDPANHAMTRVLTLQSGDAVTVRITQPGRAGTDLEATTDRSVSAAEVQEITRLMSRMLRLDEDHKVIKSFHTVDPRWKAAPHRGRGRLMRSASFFEDVIKTVTSCNVTWPSTVSMNRKLCEALGAASPTGGVSFPTAEVLADTRPASLRARCSVGYRDQRIVDIAKLFATGQVDPSWFESPATSDDDVHAALLEWPGIGPYAAANIMQLLGRYSRLPLDTESLRHARSILKMKGTDRQLMKRLHKHYEPFGEHAFRSYWFELWAFYESKRGPAWTWERETTGKTFTAALLKEDPSVLDDAEQPRQRASSQRRRTAGDAASRGRAR